MQNMKMVNMERVDVCARRDARNVKIPRNMINAPTGDTLREEVRNMGIKLKNGDYQSVQLIRGHFTLVVTNGHKICTTPFASEEAANEYFWIRVDKYGRA